MTEKDRLVAVTMLAITTAVASLVRPDLAIPGSRRDGISRFFGGAFSSLFPARQAIRGGKSEK